MIKEDNIRSLCLQLTNNCNFKCSYCYLDCEKKDQSVMSRDTASKIVFWLLQLADSQSFSPLIIFFGGEPLLNFDVLKFIVLKCRQYEKEGYPRVDFVIISNGYFLNQEVADFFCMENIKVSISLDGDKNIQEKHKRTASKDSFLTIKNNLKYFLNIGGEVKIQAVITREHVDNIRDNINFFESIGIPYIFSPVILQKEESSLALKEDDISLITKEQCCFYREDIYRKKKINNLNISELFNILDSGKGREYPCKAGISYIAIDTKGFFYPCHRFLEKKEYILGKVGEHIDFYKNKSIVGFSLKKRDSCKNCKINFFCGGNCYYEQAIGNKTGCQYKMMLILSFINIFTMNTERYNVETTCNDINDNIFSSVFQKNKNVSLIDLDDDGIFSIENGKKYIVNISAMAIWDLLDGIRTAQEVTQEIASICEVDFESIKDDIYSQIATFQKLGLVDEISLKNYV